ncbi:MAG: zinc-ribbon domain-containing protein [Bacillota bacterium]
MFIIFGWGKQTVKTHGPVHVYHCENCNNDRNWILYSKKTWFTLFFIPVIPYSSQNAILCPVCNYGIKLTKEQFDELKPVAQCNMDLVNKRITPEEHRERISHIANLQYESNLSGKTETQQNYLKQVREYEQEKEANKQESSSIEG